MGLLRIRKQKRSQFPPMGMPSFVSYSQVMLAAQLKGTGPEK